MNVDAAFGRVGQFSVRFRWLVTLVWVLVALSALGILMDTFLVRTLLVPSTVVLLGRWNWWPAKLAVEEPAALGVSGDRSD